MNINDVTVVIATLGQPFVKRTIQALNSGALPPAEIILSVPLGCDLDVSEFSNCKIIYNKKRAQVSQRANGFLEAKSNLVLQLDDDIILRENCLELLVETLTSLGRKSMVSPAILDQKTGKSFYDDEDVQSFFRFFYLYIINGKRKYQPGAITSVGSCFGPKYSFKHNHPIPVEWLPGGCIIHFRENVILGDYFPFQGKAYGEDLIASHLYKQMGIKLFVDSSALCFTSKDHTHSNSLAELFKEMNSKIYYLKSIGNMSPRFYFYYFLRFIKTVIKF